MADKPLHQHELVRKLDDLFLRAHAASKYSRVGERVRRSGGPYFGLGGALFGLVVLGMYLFEFMMGFVRISVLSGEEKLQARTRIVRAPGTTARAILEFVFTKKAFEITFAQAIANMREEHAEALHMKDFAKARWIVFRDHLNLLLTVLAYLLATIANRLAGIWKLIQ